MIWNPGAETLRRSELESLQLERLRATLRRAAERVPFYRDAFAGARMTPESIRSLADLERIPFTLKAHFRESYPFGLFAVPVTQVSRIHASSGTRGKPTVVGYTKNDLQVWREVMARSLAAAGAEPGQVIQIAYGYGLFTGGLGFHDAAEYMGLTVVPVSSGNTLLQIMLLQDFRPQGLACTPSFALHIGETLREQGVEPSKLGLRYGLFGAEPWSEELRREIEAVLALTAVDFYGLSEIIGPGVSVECAEVRDGLHINEDHFLPEIVDSAGNRLPSGTEGELVLTALTKEALLAIRYRTGDVTSLNPEPCKCGRTTVRMARIKGRTDDMLVIKGVNVYPSQVEAALLAIEDLAPHYQLVVDRTRGFPSLEVHVEPAERLVQRWGRFEPSNPELAALRQRISDRLRAMLTLNPEIVVDPPKTIPRSVGKAVRVVEKKSVGV
ncbi:MAG: phenylacetate--CoA ligase [Candidatus Rokubacteria bacterium]|nr:phenylacetate--CoA ligase [Candidatus Rokubacteria bacterium]